MATPPGDAVEPLINELRARVAQRRKDGFYPEDLEAELESHFARVLARRGRGDVEDLRSNLRTLEVRGLFSPERIPDDTSLPGGALVHRTVRRLVARQTQGILEQVQEFADTVREMLTRITELLEDPHGHVHADLVGQLDAIFERLASYERGPTNGAVAIGDLRRRVEAIEATQHQRTFQPWYTADAFESEFRGTHDELVARYRELAARFKGHAPVLDVGCGRGEFLELLQEHDIECRGVEIDAKLVTDARNAGLDVTKADALDHLGALPDDSLGGIVLLQVIEHLAPQTAIDLVAVARHKLSPGGLIIVETVNPQSLYTFAHSFYVDPTHSNPVHPAYLTFLFRQSGYSHVEIEWRTDPPAEEVLEADPAATEIEKANVRRLNQLLFAPQDYALIAYR